MKNFIILIFIAEFLFSPTSKGSEKKTELLKRVAEEKAKENRRLFQVKVNKRFQLIERLELIAKEEQDINFQDSQGKTAIILAAELGQRRNVKKLMAAGASIEIRDYNDRSALSYAAREKHFDISKILLEAGANPEDQIWLGQTIYKLELPKYKEYYKNIDKFEVRNLERKSCCTIS